MVWVSDLNGLGGLIDLSALIGLSGRLNDYTSPHMQCIKVRAHSGFDAAAGTTRDGNAKH